MSTFDGKTAEFPEIRIDHFRVSPKEKVKPLAFFLSHVHSDHLAGLESCKSPFIYCSPATRELLLKLEKYPHRMNFAKGILEVQCQTYTHLARLLKPIPLETPTTIELSPGNAIRVTLFDANHCTGAVAFLIENEKHAILYTGDVRSEQWWVDSLTRSPLLIPYICQHGQPPLRRLDCIYLDTTFASDSPRYKHFPSKKDGVQELLTAVARYPSDTIFYFNAWTFGYEEVWVALAAFLKARVHLDDYRYGVYSSLGNPALLKPQESHLMLGFHCGNHWQKGVISRSQSRLHSCEAGTNCEVFKQEHVRITPIISRWNGEDMPELGAGGGHGDLDQQHELELGDQTTVEGLISLCHSRLEDAPHVAMAIETFLSKFLESFQSAIQLDGNVLRDEGSQDDLAAFHEMPLDKLVPAIVKFVQDKQDKQPKQRQSRNLDLRADGLQKRIYFPYSRHSSLEELCLLLKAFLPHEIHPCTVDKQNWTNSHSMSNLFGHLYPPGKSFRHDSIMQDITRKRPLEVGDQVEQSVEESATTQKSHAPVLGSPFHTPVVKRPRIASQDDTTQPSKQAQPLTVPDIVTATREDAPRSRPPAVMGPPTTPASRSRQAQPVAPTTRIPAQQDPRITRHVSADQTINAAPVQQMEQRAEVSSPDQTAQPAPAPSTSTVTKDKEEIENSESSSDEEMIYIPLTLHERTRNAFRIDAYEAALAGRWHEIELISTRRRDDEEL